MNVRVLPSGHEFHADGSQSLLQAALLSGIELPSSCRNGTCRTCICQLVSGEISYTIAWPGLSAEEKAQGLILPCVAMPLSDLVLALDGATKVTATARRSGGATATINQT